MKLSRGFSAWLFHQDGWLADAVLASFVLMFLGDRRVRNLVDYETQRTCSQRVGIGGGICYFLWDRDNHGPLRMRLSPEWRQDRAVSTLSR